MQWLVPSYEGHLKTQVETHREKEGDCGGRGILDNAAPAKDTRDSWYHEQLGGRKKEGPPCTPWFRTSSHKTESTNPVSIPCPVICYGQLGARNLQTIFCVSSLGKHPFPVSPAGSGGTNAMPMTSGWTQNPGLGNQHGLGYGQEQGCD